MPPPSDGRFARYIHASMPAGITLPPEFVAALEWMDDHDCVRRSARREGVRYATLYPARAPERGMSCVSIHAVDPADAVYWMGEGVEGADRLAPFIRTGGDGSYAALWRDPEDRLRFVHLGSGSGSTWAGVITDDPVQMLRFLAIGYPEPCWPETFAATPLEAYEEDDFSDEAPFLPPEQFQQWVTDRFGVTIPPRADALIHAAPNMDDPNPTDPFLIWLKAAQDKAA
ncbi:hypothetical protein [Sphingomonas sp.]|uniref:hypothetical protein n=1 Tax=Sphingomonas sp. TaxID=28214 RepID=UPI003B3BCB82